MHTQDYHTQITRTRRTSGRTWYEDVSAHANRVATCNQISLSPVPYAHKHTNYLCSQRPTVVFKQSNLTGNETKMESYKRYRQGLVLGAFQSNQIP